MMDTPLVSIIIPCYNYGHVISETLNCLIKQTHTNWEAIIIDDGSTDDTNKIVSDYARKDNRFKYFHKSNQGLSSARNTGLKKSKGEFIQFLDADDTISALKLELQIKHFADNALIDLSYTSARYFVDGKPDSTFATIFRTQKNWIPQINGHGFDILSVLLEKNIMPVSSPLIRKKIIGDLQFSDNLKSLEDWSFWINLAYKGAIFSYISNELALTYIRVHKISMAHNQKKMFQYELIVRQNNAQILNNYQYEIKISNDQLQTLKKINNKTIASYTIYNGKLYKGINLYFRLTNFKVIMVFDIIKDILRYLKYNYIGNLK